jgi:hypothetical protein
MHSQLEPITGFLVGVRRILKADRLRRKVSELGFLARKAKLVVLTAMTLTA